MTDTFFSFFEALAEIANGLFDDIYFKCLVDHMVKLKPEDILNFTTDENGVGADVYFVED